MIFIKKKKKHTQTKRFLYTGQPCALFIWKFWVFLSGVCRNTAYTLWKACSIHRWQVECISINVKRLFITLWCIHLEQGKSKAANFSFLPGFVVWGAQALRSLYLKTENSMNYASPLAYGCCAQSYLLINFMIGLEWIPYNNCVLVKQWRIEWLRFEGYFIW